VNCLKQSEYQTENINQMKRGPANLAQYNQGEL